MDLRLNNISDKRDARKHRTRRGRGIGSGLGKTAGRGHKGQKARTGVALKGHEGGQMPLHRRLPKRGFRSRKIKPWCIVNVGDIQSAVDKGRLLEDVIITERDLLRSGLLSDGKYFARILGDGIVSSKLHLEIPYASKPAIEKIEKMGGSIKILPRSKLESSLPTKYKYEYRDDNWGTREMVARLGEGEIMHLKTHLLSNEVKSGEEISLFVEINVQSDDKDMSEEQLDEYYLYFGGFGASTKRDVLRLTDVFRQAASSEGKFETEIKFQPEREGEIKVFVGLTHAGNRLVRRSHVLHCQPS